MTKEYFEAISHSSLVDMAVILAKKDAIYQDILKELSERTCENCKHFILDDVMNEMSMYQCGNCEAEVYTMSYSNDFSCNKWESKDAK